MPGVDDGAKTVDESLALLNMMKKQGITHVIATPHFYAMDDSLEEYINRINLSYNKLMDAVNETELPKIYLGSEVLYYRYIGQSESVYKFCLNKSNYLLLELADNCIDSGLFEDILKLRDNMGITPIIAHLERYYRASGYKKLLKFIRDEKILTQINASSLFIDSYSKTVEKLIKKGIINFIATDAHSPDSRPPMMKDALIKISEKLGREYLSVFLRNSQLLLEQIDAQG